MVEAQLNGFLPSDFVAETMPRIVVGGPSSAAYSASFPPVEIHDARQLQARGGLEAEFFAVYFRRIIELASPAAH